MNEYLIFTAVFVAALLIQSAINEKDKLINRLNKRISELESVIQYP